ncbi:hypothetical protein [Vibrio caribbeanicus]|uniref:hypothetical protein n=1 Tax=Vibrio caribbeanicus TaxID=701175 RepID=UPI0030DA081C
MTLRNFARLATGMGFVTVAPKVIENYQVAIKTQGPYHPEGTSRIDSILATNHYKAGQVGFGVNGCIKMIYIGLRGFGEAEIGKVFCHQKVQDMLSNPSTWPDHLAVAKTEVNYWREIAANSDSWEEQVGAGIATCFNAESRVFIQETMEKFRKALIS